MRLVILLAIIAGAFYYCWIVPRRERDSRGRITGRPSRSTIVLFSILLVLIGGSEARWQYLQHEASVALKEVTGNPDATLKCQRISASWIDMDSGSIGGKVYGDSVNTAHMKYSECADLFWWMQSLDKSAPSQKQVWAVHVLTHEGIHTTGEFNEAVTECTAIQRDAKMAVALGTNEETGLSLQRNYFENFYPRMSSAYTLSGCTIDPAFDSLLSPAKEQ